MPAIRVGAYSAGLFDFDAFKAFLLTAAPNPDNSCALPNDVDLFLTADMRGCQFLAYGADRNNLKVEHNNCIAAPANYGARHGAVAGGGHATMISLRPVAAVCAGANGGFPAGRASHGSSRRV